MSINAVLRELFSHETQVNIAAQLTALGLPCEQTKVSAWKRSRVPTLDQLTVIERWAGKPHGWILARAGYGAPVGDAEPISQPDGETATPDLADRVASLERQIGELRAWVLDVLTGSVGLQRDATEIALGLSQQEARPSQH